ncbi:hypothetical protein BAE44_0009335, partial [Dichanthelium oligosanthes]
LLFREAKFLVSMHFNSVDVLFAPRSYNIVLMSFARFGRSWDPDQTVVWLSPLPEFVSSLVVGDLTEPLVNE